MKANLFIEWLKSREGIYYVLLALLLVVVFPLALDSFRLNMVGKYLTYAFAAMGLVLCWGRSGILSLGQGIFFGLGGYCMAMFLKLEASSPENTAIQSTPGIPDFMDWNQLTALPWFWEPFHSFSFTLIAVVAVPALLALIIAVAMFKRRVGGVYFAIITQAIAAILTILIIGQQGYTGGVNGITDLQTLKGWDIRTDEARTTLYFVCVGMLFLCLFVARLVQNRKLGRILVAMNAQEMRVRFSGYDVAAFKIFVFCLAAGLAGIGGALFWSQGAALLGGAAAPGESASDGGPERAEGTPGAFFADALADTDCAYATLREGGALAGGIEAFAGTGVATGPLDLDYAGRFGDQPQMTLREVSPAQCSVPRLARSFQGTTAPAVELALDPDRQSKTEGIVGTVTGAGDRTLWLALVAPSGRIFALTQQVQPPVDGVREFAFRMPAAQPGTYLLVTIASDRPLTRTGALKDGTAAADAMDLIGRELAGDSAGAVDIGFLDVPR